MNRLLSGLFTVPLLFIATVSWDYGCTRPALYGSGRMAASSQVPYFSALISLADDDGSSGSVSVSTYFPAANVVAIIDSGAVATSAGGDHDCALMDSGALKCWGENDFGGVGDGSTTSYNNPVDVSGLGSGVKQVSAGGFHTCALMTSGKVKCWGLNKYGQLGDATTDDKYSPVDVPGASGVSAVSAGGNHTCLLLNSGMVQCFGRNRDGQVGDGTRDDKLRPVQTLLGVNAKQIATGIYHTCALTNNGSVKCWGDNTASELGDGTTTDRLQPVDVQRLSGVKEISARSGFHTCVLLESGAVKCWGFNGFGQLGDGTFEPRSEPVDVIGLSSGVISVSAGGFHSCALLSSGTVKCWGKNTLGELANGNNTNATKPTNVLGIGAVVKAISAGGYGASPDVDDSCVLLEKGAVKCWGYAFTDY